MKRQIIFAVAATSLAITASGCASDGSSPTSAKGSAYCTSFADSTSAFQDMSSGDIGSFGEAFAVFHELAAISPEPISAEWRTLDLAFVAIEEGLAGAGLDIQQLDAVVSRGTIPDGVDVTKLQQVMEEMGQLGSAEFAAAADTIEQYGRDECDVDLSS